MPQHIVLTQGYSGRPLKLEVANIRSITDYVNSTEAWGISRRAGDPNRDFPVAWIEYASPAGKQGAGTATEYLVALQSRDEIRQAIRDGVTDLRSTPGARDRLKDFLTGALAGGTRQFSVYEAFGTEAARDTWRMGRLAEMPVAALIANLEAGWHLCAPVQQIEGRMMRPPVQRRPR